MDFARSITLFSKLQNSTNVEKEFEDKLAKCIQKKKKYVDKNFYPTVTPNDEDRTILKDAEWKYVEEVYSNNNLFDEILPNQIGQGSLGDCYLIAALIYLAHFPGRIKTIFHPKSSLEHGIVLIYFHVMGQTLPVIVDTRLPFITEYSEKDGDKKNPKFKPLFAYSRNDDYSPAWFALIEKAYAKICGGYAEIESGQSHIVIHNLLGWFGNVYNNSQTYEERDKMFGILHKLNMINASLSCSFTYSHINTQSSLNSLEQYYGLVQGHAYQILDVKEACGMKFLKLRNPWCKFEWKGDYSRNSDKWTYLLKQELDYDNPDDINDGTFWMKYEDFYTFFGEISYSIPQEPGCYEHSFCGVIDGYLDNRIPCANSRNAGCLPQWSVKFNEPCTIRIDAEISGPHAFYGINIAYNNGKKIQTMTTDIDGIRDGNDSQIHGIKFKIDKTDKPWTIFLDRTYDSPEKLDKPSYFRIAIESIRDFTVKKIAYDLNMMHHTSASGVFLPGGEDGWDPYGSKPITSCRQWSFKFTKPTTLFVRIFKSISESNHSIVFGYTNEKMSYIYKDIHAQHYNLNACSDYEEVSFDVDKVDKSYSLCIYRDKASDVSRYKFIAYSDDFFEFKELPDGNCYIYKESAEFPEIQPVKQPESFKPHHSTVEYSEYQLPSAKYSFLS